MTLKTIQSLLSAITSDAQLQEMFDDTLPQNICVISVGEHATGAIINNNMHQEDALRAAEPLLKYAELKFRQCTCKPCTSNLAGTRLALRILCDLFEGKNETKH